MVFVTGPRQEGKTTLARRILESWPSGADLSWDNREDRKEIRVARGPAGEALVVLDEFHEWKGWKGWLKGEFDGHRERLRFLVTGSARLEALAEGMSRPDGDPREALPPLPHPAVRVAKGPRSITCGTATGGKWTSW